jgi:hypothetical protein
MVVRQLRKAVVPKPVPFLAQSAAAALIVAYTRVGIFGVLGMVKIRSNLREALAGRLPM